MRRGGSICVWRVEEHGTRSERITALSYGPAVTARPGLRGRLLAALRGLNDAGGREVAPQFVRQPLDTGELVQLGGATVQDVDHGLPSRIYP